MKRFEKTIIAFFGVCGISLLIVATNISHSTIYKSPKASFAKAAIGTDTALSNIFSSLKSNNTNAHEYLTVSALSEKFTTLDYDFENILNEGATVPRILVINMPRDIRKINTPADRKLVFFKTILPLVLEANKYILRDRARLLRIKNQKPKTGKVSVTDRLWLAGLFESYEVERDNISELLSRVDIIPPSIALAQAAEESGWGTSRFVLEGNALFGQYTSGTKYSLVPRDREKGKDHNIRAFATLLDAVRSYAQNLNTHRAYRKFRNARQLFRKNGYEIIGEKLVSELTSYSERGEKYVRTIRSIINLNRLKNLDKAKIQTDFIIREPSQQIEP